MHIGFKIAKIRKKGGISQEELAKGIVSQSHLCNIENGRYIPHNDILSLFENRLKCKTDYLTKYKSFDNTLHDTLKHLYQKIIYNLEEITLLQNSIFNNNPVINSLEQELFYLIIKGIFLFEKGSIQEASTYYEEELNPLLGKKHDVGFANYIQESFCYCKGLYHYYKTEYSNSIDYLEKNLSISDDPYINSKVQYYLSCCYLSLGDYLNAKSFADQSLKTNQMLNKWENVTKIHLLYSQIYCEKCENDKALKELLTAINICHEHNIPHQKVEIYKIIAEILYKRNNYKAALYYFNKNFFYHKKYGIKAPNISFYYIINIYIKFDRIDMAYKFLSKNSDVYEYPLEIACTNIVKLRLYPKNSEAPQIADKLKSLLNILEKLKKWDIIIDICEELAQYYRGNH